MSSSYFRAIREAKTDEERQRISDEYIEALDDFVAHPETYELDDDDVLVKKGEKSAFEETMAQLARYEDTLRQIANLVGGPTMGYESSIAISEWRKRAEMISDLVAKALA